MLHVNLILETRKVSANGTHDLKIRVSRKKEVFFISTGIKLAPDQWDGNKITNHPNKQTLNLNIISLLHAYTEAAYRLQVEESKLTMEEIKQRMQMLVDPSSHKPQQKTIIDCIEEYIEKFTKPNTIQVYRSTIRRIQQHGDICIDNINVAWLNAFDKWLISYCPKKNSRNIHFRNIRAAINYAIDMGYTTNYPFRRFSLKQEETIHRTLTRDQLKQIATTDYHDDIINYHRDMFMLSFYLIGINYEDLAHLQEIVRGRVNFHRAKTNRLYSIKVEPEALEIIKRHPGSQHLVNILGRYATSHTLICKSNFNLKKIMPDLTTYYARHTWATLAAELDIPKETISAALGHSIGSTVTSIYINFDQKKVDEANRKVIDYVLSE